MEILINICIIYSIKTLYCIPKRYSQLFYIYCMSPYILYNALFNTNLVSYKYVKFLRLLCYPEANTNITYTGNCKGYHQLQKKCYDINEFKQMFLKVFSLYTKYYSIHSLYLAIFKRYSLRKICHLECKNIIQSTSFLFFQNALQRIALCNVSNLKLLDTILVTSLCSYPILFENVSRVSQINTMMLSNVVISFINKFYKTHKINITTLFLLLSFYKTRKINTVTLCLSLLNALTEYKLSNLISECRNLSKITINKFNEESPIMSIPWHPFL